MRIESLERVAEARYESPSATVIGIEPERVFCDSTSPGGTESLEEGNDWDFGW